MPTQTTTAVIAFGSNLGDETSVFHETCSRLVALKHVDSLNASRLHRTKPVGGPADQPDYLNAAIRLDTALTATELHLQLRNIETELGRQRRVRWGPRTIDLDLLLFGDQRIETETLTIPHPRMTFRRFVLEPASEIGPELFHPVAQLTIAELLEHLNQKPNSILWVANDRSVAEQVCKRILGDEATTGWEILPIDSVSDFQNLMSNAKLVAWSQDHPLEFSETTFRGPQVILPIQQELIERELLAAMEAMRPIQEARSASK